jgi:UDP-glucose 4-epimerase
MRVLVTGGAGFLGSHIADELVRRRHDVVVLDSVPTLGVDRESVVADIRNAEAVGVSMEGCQAVFHCAAIADLARAREEPRTAIEVNVLGTLNVLEAAASTGLPRVMHASSVYVFSKGGSVYRTTKQAAENLVQDLAGGLGLSATVLRFGSLYGPRADAQNAIARLVSQAVSEGRIDFWGDGTETREYVHIRDAASLAVDALDDRFAGQALHITGRERLTTIELLEMINEILGGQLDISLRDEPFDGRYRLTPYSFETSLGRRLTADTYVDLGLGLLEAIQEATERQRDSSGSPWLPSS